MMGEGAWRPSISTRSSRLYCSAIRNMTSRNAWSHAVEYKSLHVSRLQSCGCGFVISCAIRLASMHRPFAGIVQEPVFVQPRRHVRDVLSRLVMLRAHRGIGHHPLIDPIAHLGIRSGAFCRFTPNAQAPRLLRGTPADMPGIGCVSFRKKIVIPPRSGASGGFTFLCLAR